MKKPAILGGVTGQAQSHATKGIVAPRSLPEPRAASKPSGMSGGKEGER